MSRAPEPTPVADYLAAVARQRPKYRAVPTVIDGIRFASKAEARRYGELRLLEQAGEIRDLVRQPRFALYVPLPPSDSWQAWSVDQDVPPATLNLCHGEY